MDETESNDEDSRLFETELNPNHTHFIFVDDGSCGIDGKEIEFRSKLENELRKGKSNFYYEKCRLSKRKRFVSETSDNYVEVGDEEHDYDFYENPNEELKPGLKKDIIPMVLIVVQGDWTTLAIVEDAIAKNIPVLVLAVKKILFKNLFSKY